MDRQTETLIHRYLQKLNIVPGNKRYKINPLESIAAEELMSKENMMIQEQPQYKKNTVKVPKKAAIIMFLESIDVQTNEKLVERVSTYIRESKSQMPEQQQQTSFKLKKRKNKKRIPLESIGSLTSLHQQENKRTHQQSKKQQPKQQRSYNTMMMSAQFRLDETRKVEEAARARRKAIEEEIERVEKQRQVMLERQKEEEAAAREEEERFAREREDLDSAVSESLTDSQELLDSFDDNYSVRSSMMSSQQAYSETSSYSSLRISNKLQAARNSRRKKKYQEEYTPRYNFDDIPKEEEEITSTTVGEDDDAPMKSMQEIPSTEAISPMNKAVVEEMQSSDEHQPKKSKKRAPAVVGGIASMYTTMQAPKRGNLTLLKAKNPTLSKTNTRRRPTSSPATRRQPIQKKKRPTSSLREHIVAQRAQREQEQPDLLEEENFVVEKKRRHLRSSSSSESSSGSQKSKRMLTMRHLDGSFQLIDESPVTTKPDQLASTARPTFPSSPTNLSPNNVSPTNVFWEQNDQVDTNIPLFGQVTANENTIQKKANAIPNEDTAPPEDVPLIKCKSCSRRFNEKAYTRHTKICQKVFFTKRHAFTVNRVTDEAKQMQDPTGAEQPAPVVPARTTSNDGRVTCKHCQRKFSPKVHDTHVVKCKDIRAKPTRLTRRRASSLMR